MLPVIHCWCWCRLTFNMNVRLAPERATPRHEIMRSAAFYLFINHALPPFLSLSLSWIHVDILFGCIPDNLSYLSPAAFFPTLALLNSIFRVVFVSAPVLTTLSLSPHTHTISFPSFCFSFVSHESLYDSASVKRRKIRLSGSIPGCN